MNFASNDPAVSAPSARPEPARAGTAPARDIRLDFFRGLAMFIILIAHIPFNKLAGYIPARFGWSDAAEIFVFCSGMASSIAFGKIFITRGWGMGCARVIYRIWQVYWAHIGLFFAITATMAALDLSGVFERYGSFEKSYVVSMNLAWFFENPEANLVALMTLTYVPNYFDILPMYLVILAMIPLMMALAKIHPAVAMATSVALWAVAQTGALALPAEPWTDREWYFNPFGWQLVFFTGFAFIRGWLPPPPVSRVLMALAIVYLIVSIPFGRWQIWTQVPWMEAWIEANVLLHLKTNEGILRYLHFLSLAYLAWALAGPGGARLKTTGTGRLARLWQSALRHILKVGQQSLAIFVFSMWFAQMLGFALDFTAARGWAPALVVNLVGLLAVVGVAHLTGWFKSAPWRSRG